MKGVVVGVVVGLGVVILVWWYAGSSGKFSSQRVRGVRKRGPSSVDDGQNHGADFLFSLI